MAVPCNYQIHQQSHHHHHPRMCPPRPHPHRSQHLISTLPRPLYHGRMRFQYQYDQLCSHQIPQITTRSSIHRDLPTTFNIECLNHHRCRTIFSPTPINPSANYNITTMTSEIIGTLTTLGLANYIHRIRTIYNTMNPGADGSISFEPLTVTKPAIKLVML